MSSHKKSAFTLIEILLVLSGFIVLIGVIFGLYQSLFSIKSNVSARQALVEQTYYTLERIQILLQDFTIDYEEYRNRQIVGCSSDGGQRDVGELGYCQYFTHYGNYNSLNTLNESHRLYYCSSTQSQQNPPVIYNPNMRLEGEGCFDAVYFTPLYYQSFGQYAKHFQDVKDDANGDGNLVGDADEDLGIGPSAILGTGVQEIYLISPDQTQRLFIRRALVEQEDVDGDGDFSDTEKRYTLQILRLQGLDAGSNHNFALNDNTVYDGQIDTRVCDVAQGFICTGDSPGGAYSGFNMPADADDGWVDILDNRITVADRSLQIFPTANPYYARRDDSVQINPYIRIFMNVKLYAGYWQTRLGVDRNISDFSFPIQTTFNIKTWYTK